MVIHGNLLLTTRLRRMTDYVGSFWRAANSIRRSRSFTRIGVLALASTCDDEDPQLLRDYF